MLDRFQLKLLMLLFMLLDHIGSFIPNTPIWLNYIGRVVAPVFFYLLVDGYLRTRNTNNYAKRLFLASSAMTIGNIVLSMLFPIKNQFFSLNNYIITLVFVLLLLFNTYFLWKASCEGENKLLLPGAVLVLAPVLLNFISYNLIAIRNNIFLSMALCIIWLDAIEKNNIQNNTSIRFKTIGILFLCLFTEASILGPAMTYIFYKYRENKRALVVYYLVISLTFAITDLSYQGLFYKNIQWMMAFAIPFFYLYSGKKGRDLKYLFYLFYPIHIWILYIISCLWNK